MRGTLALAPNSIPTCKRESLQILSRDVEEG